MGRVSNAWNILTNNIGNFIKILLFSYFVSLLLGVLCIIPLGVGVILSLIISVLLTYIEVFLTNFLLKKQEIMHLMNHVICLVVFFFIIWCFL